VARIPRERRAILFSGQLQASAKSSKPCFFLPPALGTDFGFLAGAGVLSPNLILK
jgi:hypothetical protein